MNLDDLRRLEQAATKGPWTATLKAGAWRVLPSFGTFEVCDTGDDTPAAGDDAALIAAARNALPALLAVLKAAREWRDADDAWHVAADGITRGPDDEMDARIAVFHEVDQREIEAHTALRAALAALEAQP